MKFEEVLPALREGKKITRKDEFWKKYYGFLSLSETKNDILTESVIIDYYKITKDDLMADDWEIVNEKKKVKLRDLTEEQYKKWQRKNCVDNECRDCILCSVYCIPGSVVCWIKHKDLYSDKFLDQEIEIEEE